jgi:hypothetical protein
MLLSRTSRPLGGHIASSLESITSSLNVTSPLVGIRHVTKKAHDEIDGDNLLDDGEPPPSQARSSLVSPHLPLCSPHHYKTMSLSIPLAAFRPGQPRPLLADFQVSLAEARRLFNGWNDARLLAPRNLWREDPSRAQVRPSYLPFWAFDMECDISYSCEVGIPKKGSAAAASSSSSSSSSGDLQGFLERFRGGSSSSRTGDNADGSSSKLNEADYTWRPLDWRTFAEGRAMDWRQPHMQVQLPCHCVYHFCTFFVT